MHCGCVTLADANTKCPSVCIGLTLYGDPVQSLQAVLAWIAGYTPDEPLPWWVPDEQELFCDCKHMHNRNQQALRHCWINHAMSNNCSETQ